jgi:hypothetical protein
MRGANALAGIAISLWLALAFIGRGLIYGVIEQHVLGYPNRGQIEYYLTIPVAVAIALLICAWLCNAIRRLPWLLAVVSALSMLALGPYLLPYSGGV